ncbi:hypothetical protein EJ08DRAFT_625712 [Tothia fuscella]|uniref:DUF6594 domain-containing protein n=1 Tax=Tothia fuscella TaxID=1048955 RepID=A0A9P4NZE2_9PEZI|nr:hypothetical protein EJ08DRAFT_625712 [Tothia fuscella]
MDDIQSGYAFFSRLIRVERRFMIYRSFAELNARNLLYLQAELVDLEQDLLYVTGKDYCSKDMAERRFLLNARELREGNGQQWAKVLEIREKLKEYNAALLQQAEVNRLEPAKPQDVKLLEDWLRHEDGGKGFLEGYERAPYDELQTPDLISLYSEPSVDKLTGWVGNRLVPWLHNKVLHRIRTPLPGHEGVGLVKYDDKHFKRFERVLGVLLSTLYPSVAILSLYYIKSLLHRLIAIIFFSMLCACSLAFMTSARSVEIFAATAACASVQVVFVGSTST